MNSRGNKYLEKPVRDCNLEGNFIDQFRIKLLK